MRREETPDTLAPKVLYLWNRKWWIMLATIAAFFIGYFTMVAMPSDFTASAELYVNRLAVFQDNQLNPSTVATLITSDEPLLKVRDAFADHFKVPKPVFEKFAKQFKAKTDILQDTTVKKDVSPIVLLSVVSRGKEETYFLMKSWLQVIARDYANVGVNEAVFQLEALRKEEAQLEKALQDAERLQAQYALEYPLYQKMIAEYANVIAPAQLQDIEPPRQVPSLTQENQMAMQVSINNPPPKSPGLISMAAQLQVQSQDAATTGAEALQKKIDHISTVINDQLTSISALQSKAAEIRQKYFTVTRDIQAKTSLQQELHKFMDKVSVVASLKRESREGGGDLRILTAPVMPELRIWPKRTAVAAVCAIAAFFITVAAFLVHQYVREAAERHSATIA